MLGVIHRAVIGEGPEQFRKHFRAQEKPLRPEGREAIRRHSKQLETYRKGHFLEIVSHSILGLVDIYNLLPADVIEAKTVKNFQQRLQAMMKLSAYNGEGNWEFLFSPRMTLYNHQLRKAHKDKWPAFMKKEG